MPEKKPRLHPNVWAVSLTSFLTDISSEMIINLVPLFMLNVLKIKMALIGLIEGMAETIASLLKFISGLAADRFKSKKKLTVIGYSFSAFSKPLFFFASSWGLVALARWLDRIGKGIRTAPRDALLADSVKKEQRGLAFGLHRAADTAGAFVGLFVALLIINALQKQQIDLKAATFKTIVLVSLIPAFLAVIVLVLLAREIPSSQSGSGFSLKNLSASFYKLMAIIFIFELGNSSDAFIIMRAQERGMSISGIIIMLIAFNFVYASISTPAGKLSDLLERKKIVLAGWILYALIYLGFAFVSGKNFVFILYVIYGIYYGTTFGVVKALIADIVNPEVRATAFGIYSAIIGLTDLPASLIAGILWQGLGGWHGFGPQAPFIFGGCCALLASLLLLIWQKRDAA